MEIFSSSMCGEVKRSSAVFQWRIAEYRELPEGHYYSPDFNYLHMTWNLVIYKKARVAEYVGLRREFLASGGIREPVRFTVACRTDDGDERVIARDKTFPEDSRVWIQFITRPKEAPAVELVFACTLWKGDSPGAEAASRLSQHMKKLLLCGDGHDVLFRVGDKDFRAHKCVLGIRSPVFAAMFGSDMAESAEGSVTIEDSDPDAFGEFLQFVYSGKADVASVGRALGLYYAGDKYDFPSLKEMCLEFLGTSFTTTTIFDVIGLADRHDEEELLRRAVVYLAENLEEVLLTAEWQRFLAANPGQANEMNIKAVKYLKTSLCNK